MPESFYHNKRVLVTGGDGFIGRHLVPKLRECGAAVRVFDQAHGNLRCYETCEEAVADIDIVFHLAARVAGISEYQKRPWSVADQNIDLDLCVLHAAVNAKVGFYFYASSAHVDTDLSYGWAKRTGEKMLEWHAAEFGGLRTAIARIYGAYGPGQNFDLSTGSLIPVLCHRAAKYPSIPFTLQTNGRERRSYIYVADVANEIMRSVEHLQYASQVGPFDLGNPGSVSVRSIAESIVEISGKPIPIEYGEAEASIAEQRPRVENVDVPRTSLKRGLRACYEDVCSRLEVACV